MLFMEEAVIQRGPAYPMKTWRQLFILTLTTFFPAVGAVSGFAATAGLPQIREAIAEKGLHWTAADYGRTFPPPG